MTVTTPTFGATLGIVLGIATGQSPSARDMAGRAAVGALTGYALGTLLARPR